MYTLSVLHGFPLFFAEYDLFSCRIRITNRELSTNQSVPAVLLHSRQKSCNKFLCTMLNETVKGIGVDKIARNIHKQIVLILGICVVFFTSTDQSGVSTRLKKK